ncbi:hypothetical protein Gohar_010489 [Gossypium harknessii]|uniref:DUF7745 domain-containing protein n=1 Tax=Gossypium harknessii TaxID=34285 RepID=A0A7J9GSG5_9ROSI|nr:hypothetical protein [Gossypium harknessii]
MEKGYLDKVEDNAVVQIWSEKTQQEKGDSLTKGYMSELIQVNKAYSRAANVPTFLKRLMSIIGMNDIYGLVIFPKALGHIDDAVSDLFDRLNKKVAPILEILVETFRSLSACRRAGEGRFIKCDQLLLAWFHSHFWKVKKVSYQVFSENNSSLKEFVATLGEMTFLKKSRGSLYRQRKGWLSVSLRTNVIITRRRGVWSWGKR